MTAHSLERLQDALDGRLTPAERAAVEAHLAECQRCRRRERALRWTRVRLAGAADALLVPADLPLQLARAVAEADAAPSVAPDGDRPVPPPPSRAPGAEPPRRPRWFDRWRR
jgi:anti-sigma factor RsiW